MPHKVHLYIYDLSQGMASVMSPLLIGKRIDGVWHTSIVVFEREYFFSSRGVESCTPGGTVLQQPLKILSLGNTEIPYSVFLDYLNELSVSSYTSDKYNLLKHNCNTFSEELATFLCGAHVPQYILDLPNEVLQTRLGPTIAALARQLELSARPLEEEQQRQIQNHSKNLEEAHNSEARIASARLEESRQALREKLARKERRKEKKRKKKRLSMADAEMLNGNAEPESPQPVASDVQDASHRALQFEEDERLEEEQRKKAREPPIVFRNMVDVRTEFEVLNELLNGKLSGEEPQSFNELKQYMMDEEGSWIVSEGFLNFVGRLLNDTAVQNEIRVHLLNILAAAALKDDVILVLHQDRKDHILMNYAFEIDRIGIDEQQSLALFIANMFENLSSSEWLLYISEWTYNNQQISNIRVTTKVAVHSLLSDIPELQDRGTAIIYNMACKEVKSVVFDDVAVELAMALLQYFNSKPSEENLWRSMKSLAKFAQISGQEVPQLIQMIGPHPNSFKGTSQRVDEQIQAVCSRMR